MKKQLYISGKMIGSIIFEVIGIVVLIFGIRSTKNFDNAAYVTSRADLNGRQFVRVIINEYMVKPKSEVNQEFSEGICVKYTSLFGTEYSMKNNVFLYKKASKNMFLADVFSVKSLYENNYVRSF